MIKKLLKIEYKKFSKSSVVTLLISLYAILFPLLIFAGKKMVPDLPDSVPFTVDILYEFPSVWDYQGYIGTWLIFIFLGFIPIHIVCSEIRYKTLRQSIIIGLTRKEYYISKVLSILSISIVATIFYFIVCAVIGSIHTPNFSFAKLINNDFAGTRFFLSCMGYMSIALFLGFFIRRSGIALFLYLSYVIMLEPGVRWLIYWKVLKTKATLFFPANILEDVMPNPLMRFTAMMPDELEMDWLVDIGTASMVSAVYTIGFLALSYYIFIKRDI